MDRTSAKRQIKQSVREVILKQVRQSPNNRISFEKLMESALYHPIDGYYTKPTPKLGKSGDFFTNVHVSDLFGRVVADYFLQYWQQHDATSSLQLVEIGGGDGRLLQQITTQFQLKGIPSSSITIYSVERSPYHQIEQQKRLCAAPYSINWAKKVTDVPPASFAIVYSHELLDALPVHRLIWKERKWWEIYVTEKAGKLVEIVGELSSEVLQKYTSYITEDIVENQQIEVNLQAKTLLKEITNWLQSGLIWTLDYGGTARELHDVRYLDGTMRYYQKHQHVNDPYTQLGDIDMTSHINFKDCMRWGEQFGLSTCFYGTQASFLLEAGIFSYTDIVYRNAIKQLVMVMGESFQVLVQRK